MQINMFLHFISYGFIFKAVLNGQWAVGTEISISFGFEEKFCDRMSIKNTIVA